jgi:hypothetical protein
VVSIFDFVENYSLEVQNMHWHGSAKYALAYLPNFHFGAYQFLPQPYTKSI